ncbi:hypothetical protein VIGAN_07095800 [Vigna angularis var. angularis]|uniref:Late embryogenesis abundant protein LEA-2 subgroup domain-containing protein n=1 Tax=Vigna angularis var. angularis TaxID=157739 RepID=A0A0S3SHG5_PHAAN|nr:hypothetical protein VIGAN_07095800 [Vigna angularis var. angularis]
MTSEAYGPPKGYVSIEKQEYGGYPRPYGYNPRRRRGGFGLCGCLKCLCCCCGSCCRCCIYMILFIIIVLVAIGVALYYLIKPIVPSYDFEGIEINSFEMRKDDMLYTDIVVVVKAENPNEDIGMDYLENEVTVTYSGAELCSGEIPPFLQPGKNITNINVELKGETKFGAQWQNRFMEDQHVGKIPLLVTVKVPIRQTLISLQETLAAAPSSVVTVILADSRPLQHITRHHQSYATRTRETLGLHGLLAGLIVVAGDGKQQRG